MGVAAAGLPPLGDQANAVVAGAFSAIGPGVPFPFRGPMNLAIYASYNDTLTTTKGSLAASVGTGTGIAAGGSVKSANVPRGTVWGSFAGTSGNLVLPTYTYQCTNLAKSGATANQITLPPGSNVSALLGATVTVPSNVEGVTLPASTSVVAIVQQDVAPSLNSAGTPGIVQLSNAPNAVPDQSAPVPLAFALGAAAITTGVDTSAIFTGAGIVFSGTVQLERSFDGGATWLLCNVGGDGTLAQWNGGTPVSVAFGEPEKGVLYRVNCVAYTSGVINYRISASGPAATSLSVPTL